jgi:general L-amino acid transport system permease protein
VVASGERKVRESVPYARLEDRYRLRETLGVQLHEFLGRSLRRPLLVAWILLFPAVVVLLRAFGGVPPQIWGGFMLNVLLAVAATFLSFPLGVLLALGRRSTLPVISKFCRR